ncbi:hypothetical protein F5146DRAFT_1136925 [Armillaria mellea]|nr:hypothetical protein F5146DRAFT_1136925 [Armillaria mellea]
MSSVFSTTFDLTPRHQLCYSLCVAAASEQLLAAFVTLFIPIPYSGLGISTSNVAILSTSLKKLYDQGSPILSSALAFNKTFPRFNVRKLAASLVCFILRAADRQFVGVLAGNTFVSPSSIPPISTGTVPPVLLKFHTADGSKQKFTLSIIVEYCCID